MQCYWSVLFILDRPLGKAGLILCWTPPFTRSKFSWEALRRQRKGEEGGAEKDLLGHRGFAIVHKADEDRDGAFTNPPWPGIKIKGPLSLATSGWCGTLIQVQRHLEYFKQGFLTWALGFGLGERYSLNSLKIQAKCCSCEHTCIPLGRIFLAFIMQRDL